MCDCAHVPPNVSPGVRRAVWPVLKQVKLVHQGHLKPVSEKLHLIFQINPSECDTHHIRKLIHSLVRLL